MTTDDVLKRVEKIRRMADDYEIAHSEEDKLRDDVLRAISAGAPEAQMLAAAALKTGDIEFARYWA